MLASAPTESRQARLLYNRNRKGTPNGILPVDKPAGWTSFDVLAKLRGALGTRKLGHSGTLDPMATGVLAVFIGKATAAADRQLNHDKTYEATIRLGLRTDTGDITGTALETAPGPSLCTALNIWAAPPPAIISCG